MSKNIKFNLKCNDNYVRTMDDLRNNFDPEDILNYFKNGMLKKWLQTREDNNDYSVIIKKIDQLENEKDNYTIIEKMIDIFQIEDDRDILNDYYKIQEYYDWKKKSKSIENTRRDRSIEYSEIIKKIKNEIGNFEMIKKYFAEIEAKYLDIFKLNYIETFFELWENEPRAILALFIFPRIREVYFGENDEKWKTYLKERAKTNIHTYSYTHVYMLETDHPSCLTVIRLMYECIIILFKDQDLENIMEDSFITISINPGEKEKIGDPSDRIMVLTIGGGISIESLSTGEKYGKKDIDGKLMILNNVRCANEGKAAQKILYLRCD